MDKNNFLENVFTAFIYVSMASLLALPVFTIWSSTQLLLRNFSMSHVLLIWSILIVVCLTLWVFGKIREHQSENPLANILEPQQSNASPTAKLKNNFLLFWYKRKRQNNHKIRN
ncbi:MAG: hypothetical protein F6J86_05840 [Symploca sp. SIO1B1]|nr:hypothetical protein [Symploca sp. SIO1B1]